MPLLLLKKKEEILSEYALKRKEKIFIGKKKTNDIVINDSLVSDNHCTIILKNDKYYIKDQNTIAGTKINGKIIVEQEVLSNGDTISIGAYTLEYWQKNSISDDKHYLLGIYGKFEGKKYFVKNTDTFIGRELFTPKEIENDIILDNDNTVSKGHAVISFKDDKFFVEDTGSTGGVAVNGLKIGQFESFAIQSGDEISIGRSIFRFVNSSNEDYSFPQKQQIFLLRIIKPLSLAITILVTCAFLFFAFVSNQKLSVMKSYDEKLTLELNTTFKKDIVLKSLDDDYHITPTPAIGDILNNGNNALIAITDSGFLYGWDLSTGKELWNPIEVLNLDIGSPMIADVNNDGVKDIIVLSAASMLYIYDGQTGDLIRKEVIGGEIAGLTPLVADLTGNGKMDVVVCSQDGTVSFLYNVGHDKDYEKIIEYVEGPLYATPVLCNNKDGVPLVVVANNRGKIYFINGKSREKKMLDLLEKTGKEHFIVAAPAVGDITKNNISDIVVQTSHPQYVTAIDVSNLNVLWSFLVEPNPPLDLEYTASPLISNGNVFVVSANGSVYNLKGKTNYPSGELLSKLDIPDAKRIISSPSKYDFDKDGYDEFVIGTEDGRIIVVKNNIKSQELEILAEIKASNVPITSSPLIADAFGSGKLNIIFANTTNALQIVNTNSKSLKNFCPWPMHLANASHTSQETPQSKLKYYLIFYSSILVFVCFAFLKIFILIRKRFKRAKVKFL
ncbi:MAG: FHA domain-containing protein [Endomicrobium sp.]|jgi:pSer/pThr/pTyr-binding forkhead associated (FHA) protein/outer membrane protein assembly factor BamB|nr:FHA domain-containing protein [Endomicrobium sp.]